MVLKKIHLFTNLGAEIAPVDFYSKTLQVILIKENGKVKISYVPIKIMMVDIKYFQLSHSMFKSE